MCIPSKICGKITLSRERKKVLDSLAAMESSCLSGDGSADCGDGLAFHFVGTSFRYPLVN